MTNTSKTIIFFGTEDFSLTALTGLIESGYTIAAVVTKPDSKKGRGQKLVPPAVKVLATRHNIPVWQPKKLSEIDTDIRNQGDITGVLVSYGKIVPQSTIDLFTPGIINVHPSLLPKYRGPSPIESAIKNGDKETGVSIMQLSAAMDAGPVYSAKQHLLGSTETQPELYHTLADIGTNLLIETLPQIIEGDLQPTPQDESQATYCKLLRKEDALIDPRTITSLEAERHVRAFASFPKTKLRFGEHIIIITKAHTADAKKTPLDIECRDGVFLSIDELIAPSGRRMQANDFVNGYL